MPSSIVGRDADGSSIEIPLTRMTLLVVVKPGCLGCREFLHAADHELAGLELVLVSEVADDRGEWRDARAVLIAPAWIEAQRLIAAPSYALLSARTRRLIAEGAAFAVSQVMSEIASHVS